MPYSDEHRHTLRLFNVVDVASDGEHFATASFLEDVKVIVDCVSTPSDTLPLEINIHVENIKGTEHITLLVGNRRVVEYAIIDNMYMPIRLFLAPRWLVKDGDNDADPAA